MSVDPTLHTPEASRKERREQRSAARPRIRIPVSTGDLSARVRDLWTSWKDLIAPWLAPVGAVLGVISPLGWFVLTGGVLAWIGAGLLGWVELAYAAAGLLVLFTLAALLTIGRTSLEVEARIEPQRVVAGESAVAEVRGRNVGKGPLLPVPLDLPTGDSVTRFALPLLGPGSEFEDLVRLPTSRRGVFVIGPARSVRGDPLGIARRELVWTEPVEFFVHPRTVFLDSLGSGLLKDLEGQSTNDISMSDLAFHTLREYAPGDDVRHIHWKSSAKRLASGSDTFLVRQFLDTRRSHIGLLVDCAETSWVDPEEFEMAVAAGASIARRALRDEMELSQASGPFIITRPSRHTALDVWSRARMGTEDVEHVAARLSRAATNISGLIIITGPLAEFSSLRQASALFSTDVRTIVIRVERGAPVALSRAGGMTGITIGSLSDLPRALAGRGTLG